MVRRAYRLEQAPAALAVLSAGEAWNGVRRPAEAAFPRFRCGAIQGYGLFLTGGPVHSEFRGNGCDLPGCGIKGSVPCANGCRARRRSHHCPNLINNLVGVGSSRVGGHKQYACDPFAILGRPANLPAILLVVMKRGKQRCRFTFVAI